MRRQSSAPILLIVRRVRIPGPDGINSDALVDGVPADSLVIVKLHLHVIVKTNRSFPFVNSPVLLLVALCATELQRQLGQRSTDVGKTLDYAPLGTQVGRKAHAVRLDPGMRIDELDQLSVRRRSDGLKSLRINVENVVVVNRDLGFRQRLRNLLRTILDV